MKSIPIIDFAGTLAGDPAARARTVAAVYEACTQIGFFYITGHGIPQDLIDDTFAASREFYDIPDDRKTDVLVNPNFRGHKPLEMQTGFKEERTKGGAEIYTVGLDVPADSGLTGQLGYGPNPWPAAMPSFQPRVMAYFEAVRAVGAEVMAVIAESLDIDPKFFEKHYQYPTSTCVLLHYPPLPADAPLETSSGPEHTDWGSLTMLYQDNCGGLEVRNRDNEWVQAPPIEGAFVLNIGDQLQRWSNDRLVSTPHRVRNRSGKERYSIATFHNPQSNALVDPRDLGVTDAECKHPPILAGEYIASRWADFFGGQLGGAKS